MSELHGPMRWNPNDMLELDREVQWQSICAALGDTVCTDRRVLREPSAEERDMARLEATFPALADPTNTVALQTAPEVKPARTWGHLWWLVAAVPLTYWASWHISAWVVTR